MSDGKQSLTDLLDQWRRGILDGMGAGVVADIRPGLSDSDIGLFQDAVGVELLPDLREFLAWGVATNDGEGARGFLPRIKYRTLLSPKSMVLFQYVGLLAMDHHRPAETCGGIWQIDHDPGWAARDLRDLIGSCIRMFENGLLELDDDGMVDYNRDALSLGLRRTRPTKFSPAQCRNIRCVWTRTRLSTRDVSVGGHRPSRAVDARTGMGLVTTMRRRLAHLADDSEKPGTW